MQFRAFFAAAVLAATAVALPAKAQEDPAPKATGFYATLGAGASWTGNTDANNIGYNGSWTTGDTFSGKYSPKWDLGAGFAGEAGVGYDFGDVRAELTYVYKGASVGDITGSGTESGSLYGVSYNNVGYNFNFSGSGTVNTNSVFASGYYDIPTKSKWTPYVGGGIGYTNVSLPAQNGNATLNATFEGTAITATQPINQAGGSGSAFGYQAKVGIAYEVAPTADVFLEGTYQGSTSVTVNDISYSGLNAFGLRAGARIRFGS